MDPTAISSAVDFSKAIEKTKVKGKVALVTGGASGIGAGIVRALCENGAEVMIADANLDAGEQYATKLAHEGFEDQIDFMHVDVTDWGSQVSAFKTAIKSSKKKTIDLVIACAGLTGESLFQDPPFMPSDNPDSPQPPPMDVIDVNLVGAYYTACLAIHYFRHAKVKEDKQLIFFASTIAYRPIPLFSNYSASKAGVRALWKTLRESPDLTGMRTNLVAPHIVRTPMTTPLQPMLDEQGLEFAEPDEIVDMVMRMVCDDGIKGRAVAVNAGHAFDLCDDLEEGDGSRELGMVYEKETKPVLDFMAGLVRSGVEPAKSEQS